VTEVSTLTLARVGAQSGIMMRDQSVTGIRACCVSRVRVQVVTGLSVSVLRVQSATQIRVLRL
jgi:hypothetical protein